MWFLSPGQTAMKGSTPLDDAPDGKLVEVPRSRSDSKAFAIRSDRQHRLLGQFAAHLLSQHAGFFRSPSPIFGIVEEIRSSGHGTRRFSPIHLNSGNGMWFLFQIAKSKGSAE
jgi:hypothetical protein